MIFFVFTLLIMPILFFAEGSTYYFALSFFGIALFLVKYISIKSNRLFSIILFYLLVTSLFVLSTINGGSVIISMIKALQLCFLYILAFQSIENIRASKKVNILFLIYLLASVVIFIVWLMDRPSFLTDRFSSFFFDPNYFAAVILLMLAVSHSINCERTLNSRFLELLMAFFIVISFSITAIAILFFYMMSIIIFKNIINKIAFTLLIAILLISPISAILIASLLEYINDFDATSNVITSYKLTSIGQRSDVQNIALKLIINDPLILLFGIGSGRVLDFLPRAMHNGYLNLLFAHGILAYFLFCLLLYKIYKFMLSKYGENHFIISGFLSLLIFNVFIEIFFSGLVAAYFFLLNYGSFKRNCHKVEPLYKTQFIKHP